MLTSNLFLLSIAALTLVVCAVLGAVLYFAMRHGQPKPAADRKVVRLRADSLRSTFHQAVELIEANIASRAERYNIPWVMVLNEGDDARTLPIAQAGVSSALSAEAASTAATQGISWHFFDRGVVIDIQAVYLGSPDEDGDEKPWDEFLGLCRSYREQRPFDSVVITVPAAMLLAQDADARLELVRRAKLAHRRLWLAQNRFAMRFAVYVVVTGCEALTGFAAFARALPEPLRASMLGWSSPYDLSTTYQSDWVGAAMSSIERAVSDTGAELFALDTGHLDARECLLLPSRIGAMQAQLQLYVDELLRPSAYHEPFFFRGIYLTGDSSEFAQRAPEAAAQAREAAALPWVEPEALMAAGFAAEFATGETAQRGADERTDRHEPGGPLDALMLQPAFLRDLFDRKIFLEYGLTRPSRTQHLARPVLNRALRWGGIAVLGVWGVGLVVATVQLGQRNGELVAALGQLRSDAAERAAAAQRGLDLPADWYRAKALALIGLNQQLRAQPGATVFMPGSWRVVDALDARVRERFEREFGEIAVSALQREMFARVSQLTGVALDPSTGQLIIGDDCAPPGTRADLRVPGAGGLSIDDLPEMRTLQQYVGAVDQFDTALAALQSLRRPAPGNAEALRTVVRYALGAELQGDLAGTLPYFYRDAGGRATYRGDASAALALPPLQQALRCTLGKGAAQLDTRLFTNNPLLAAERTVTSNLGGLSGADAAMGNFTQLGAHARAIVEGIDAQQDLLASGKGNWMRQATFTPGPVYERTLARVAQNRLLGPDAAADIRTRDAAAFQGLRSDLALRFGGVDSGVVWSDKDARYTLAPARLALRDSLAALLNQPFMVAPRGLAMPSVPAGSTLVWDRAQLDQALALGDVRKRFLDEGLAKVPEAVKPAIGRALDLQFARLVSDQTAAAAVVTPVMGEADSAAFDAVRPRLVRIKALLAEMGANAQAEDLDTLVSQDAMAHLQLVDQALTRSELYATRASGGWEAPRTASPVLAALGVPDGGAVGPYLEQQAARAQALGQQAQRYLAALTPADAATPLAQRWQAIDRDLDRYRLKNPNSSLLMLEQFVQAVSAENGAGGCMAKFGGRASGNAGDDYFAALHARLYTSLLARCTQGYALELRQQWGGFAAAFNQSVAGRAPFSGTSASMMNVANRADPGMADYGELGQVLRRYEPISALLRDAGANGRKLATTANVRQFVDDFDQVKALLAPLYPADDGASAGYDVNVEFRANRGGEVAANQLIDWTLASGAQSVSAAEGSHALHWDYGSPVTLVLRFAKDSPLTAVADAQQRPYTTDGRTLTWQFNDPWALITFIARQRVPDASARGAGAAQLLRFDFPLGVANPADLAALPKDARGRVYLRITLMPAGKKTPLPWPGGFPARAPEWTVL
ncbi:IcmF-related protein [Paraburkholderia unamae]|uniref:type VI secretion system protein n=1 Tax=Paraburkholderia unamae TaxID=219649 RepID=UPI001CAE42AA|nr:type VI secretion system protein [Paraburkholderia unamae]CAG9252851.1 IcmF-related protein [Paraburkholderia unamae]